MIEFLFMKYTISLFLLSFSFCHYSYADMKKPKWTVFSDLKIVKVITSQEDTVEVSDWKCTVGKISVDKFGNESRRFGCSVDGSPQVFVNPICSYSKKHGRFIGSDSGFNLQMKHQSAIFVSLACSDQL